MNLFLFFNSDLPIFQEGGKTQPSETRSTLLSFLFGGTKLGIERKA